MAQKRSSLYITDTGWADENKLKPWQKLKKKKSSEFDSERKREREIEKREQEKVAGWCKKEELTHHSNFLKNHNCWNNSTKQIKAIQKCETTPVEMLSQKCGLETHEAQYQGFSAFCIMLTFTVQKQWWANHWPLTWIEAVAPECLNSHFILHCHIYWENTK